MHDTIIGIDLAKRVFQLHATSATGDLLFRKKLSRAQFHKFMSDQPPCLVVFEACGSANYWAREMASCGHAVKLIAPQYVKPFIKRQKNDAADAEAIAIAARQPEMRFVPPKSESQQTKAALFRGRERLVRQRTELTNALRALLYEFGHIFPKGISHVAKIRAFIGTSSVDLPKLVVDECAELLEQISEQTDRISDKTKALKALAEEDPSIRKLQTMPGIGPITALAVSAFGPDMAMFKSGRDFAAWLGLVPKQHSSGGKDRLGRISKAGQSDIRRLLIIGAMARIVGRARDNVPAESWLGRLLQRKPKMLVAIALANKMARQLWAMLSKNEEFRDPILTPA